MLLRSVPIHELLPKYRKTQLDGNLQRYIESFNISSEWVSTIILYSKNRKERSFRANFLCEVMYYCLKFNNFNAVTWINSAFEGKKKKKFNLIFILIFFFFFSRFFGLEVDHFKKSHFEQKVSREHKKCI